MEGLPYDFGIEDDPDDDIEKKSKKRGASLIEKLKEPEEKAEEEPGNPSKEKLKEDFEEDQADNAPELDAEAPLEHLSRVETEAIAQTMAAERLYELRQDPDELNSETLAAESFLENVEASGDIDMAYNETLAELGETAMTPDDVAVETETALPVDPESLVAEARSQLNQDVADKSRRTRGRTGSAPTVENRPSSSPRHSENRSGRLLGGMVDYLVGRRFGRLSAENRQDEIENKLSSEVGQLHNEITSRETHVRQLAQNKPFEKNPEKVRPAKAETIGKVLIKSEMSDEPELATVKRGELAAITAHTMNNAEVLKVAQGIRVEGNSLRQIYEAHLVGEKGLRRVVAEYLRGGNFRKALKRELLEREKDFERDPKLRDQASNMSMAATHADLDDLLQKSGIDWSEPQPTLTQPKVKSTNLTSLIDEIRTTGSSTRRLVDIVMISLVAAMSAVIIVLIFIR